MGAGNSTMSTAVNDIVNRTINNISTDIKSTCKIDNTNIQNVDINLSKITGCSLNITGISQNINATSTMDCKNANIDQTALENNLKNNLESGAKTVKDSPFFSFGDKASADSINKALNDITNNVNVSKIAESIMKSLNDQNIAININEYRCFPYKDKKGNIIGTELNIGDINQDILNNVVLNSLTENQNVVDATTTVDNVMKANASATSLGLSAALLAALLPLIVGLVLFVVIIVVGIKTMGGIFSRKSGKTEFVVGKAFGRSFGEQINMPNKALFFVFAIFAMIMCIVINIQIGKLTQVSKSVPLYYGLMIACMIVAITTCIMIIFYVKSGTNAMLGLMITGLILTIGLASTVIALTQMEIDDIETQIADYTTNKS